MAIIFATQDYGESGEVLFSTREELKWIMHNKKPIFLIKMCQSFKESYTDFYLPNSIFYTFWEQGSPMSTGLIDDIIRKYTSVSQSTQLPVVAINPPIASVALPVSLPASDFSNYSSKCSWFWERVPTDYRALYHISSIEGHPGKWAPYTDAQVCSLA